MWNVRAVFGLVDLFMRMTENGMFKKAHRIAGAPEHSSDMLSKSVTTVAERTVRRFETTLSLLP